MKFTTARSKVKSRSRYYVAHLHPLTNVPTNYQLPTPHGFQDIARTRFYRSSSLRQGQRSNQGHAMTLHTHYPLTNVLTKYQLSTPYSFRNIAQTRFYRSRSLQQRSKVKSRSHYDVAYLHPLINVPTKYQLPTPLTVSKI